MSISDFNIDLKANSFTSHLRRLTSSYAFNFEFSHKKFVNERSEYLELLKNNELDQVSAEKLKLNTLSFRFANSPEGNELNLFIKVCKAFKPEEETNHEEFLRILLEIYEYSFTRENFEENFVQMFNKSFPKKKIDSKCFQSNIHLVSQIYDSKDYIFSKPFIFRKMLCDEESKLKEKINLDINQIYSSKVHFARNFVIPSKKQGMDLVELSLKKTKKQSSIVKCDYKNHFKEFYSKYQDIIANKEFPEIFLFDLLMELNSSRKDHELVPLLYTYLEEQEPVEYLITFRKEIIEYVKGVGFFNKKEDKFKKRLKNNNFKPSNFIVKGMGTDEETKNYQEGTSNHEILQILGILDIEKDSKLGLKKKNIRSNAQFATIHDIHNLDKSLAMCDYTNMEIHKLTQLYPTCERSDDPEFIRFLLKPLPLANFPDDMKKAVPSLETWMHQAFAGLSHLNPIQSKVFPIAFNSDENMLVCAPTGSGKTNIALLTILREISKFFDKESQKLVSSDFKIVYISPMKALAAEIVDKFTKRLKYLGVAVREFTGDIQLSKQELISTHVIITTPEKWDVITRKNDAISGMLKLLIIDEVHLLNDDRGAVLESLVARTLRSIERIQSRVRILGLSATLPNYLDVAAFLRVPKVGVFFFDSRYRPVPLTQTFIGIKEAKGFTKIGKFRKTKLDVYNELTYANTMRKIRDGKQVLIFVHSRRETINYAKYLIETMRGDFANKELIMTTFKIKNEITSTTLRKYKSKELNSVGQFSVGFHNAGLLRHDRNLVENAFLKGELKILVSTATLAWGVNLPASAVIIKGTEIYVSGQGTTNISILDIQQIFGRAGRPQFDNEGEATLITDFDKVSHYLALMNNASNIESKFATSLKEALNAEIGINNVSTDIEAFEWIKYTFFYIRLMKDPLAYKVQISQDFDRQMQIEQYISDRIKEALMVLHDFKMIRYDTNSGFVNSTDLGRIASHYYIRAESMFSFCSKLNLYLDTNDNNTNTTELECPEDTKLLRIISESSEFESLKVRDDEVRELKFLLENCWVFSGAARESSQPVEDTLDTPLKVMCLIGGYLCKVNLETFSLVIDTNFVIQNISRMLRCLLELSFKKNLPLHVGELLKWCRYVEGRISPFEHELTHFTFESNSGSLNPFRSKLSHTHGFLPKAAVEELEKKELTVEELKESEEIELRYRLKVKGGYVKMIRSFVHMIPDLTLRVNLRPVAQTIIRASVFVKPDWKWDQKWHDKNESFHLYVHDQREILHYTTFSIDAKAVYAKSEIELTFFLPLVQESSNKEYCFIVSSDRWINCDFYEYVSIRDLILRENRTEFTELLDLKPLPKTALGNAEFEKTFKYFYFNPVQTQVFHALYHTDHNVIVGAPTGSGKTIIAELGLMRVLSKYPNTKIVYIAPLKAIARERLAEWKAKFEVQLQKKILELTGDYTPDLEALCSADIIISTPEKWDGISRNWQYRDYIKCVSLIIFDEIHMLGQERGPVIEVIVSRMNYIANKTGNSVRMIGLSTALANGKDVANWFGVPKHFFFNFRPQVRPCPITIYFDGFPEKAYCPRMATMNKPAYNAIKKFSPDKPVLIFVSSRRQTRLTALDLIAFVTLDNIRSPYLLLPLEEMEKYILRVNDTNLQQTLSFGIGIHHAGLSVNDKRIVEELFLTGKIQILCATGTLAWGVNFPAHLVIIKGTEHFDPKQRKYVDLPMTEILQMIGRAGRPQYDTKGIACVFVEQSKKGFYRKYLNDPFPIESSLHTQIIDHINAEIATGTLVDKQTCIDYLTWTYFFRRVMKNPSYYGLPSSNTDDIKTFLFKFVDSVISTLEKSGCVEVKDSFYLEPTFLGTIASYYYISNETVAHFHKEIKQNLNIIQLLKILSDSKEFSEIPVRHNEDNLNDGLARLCPYRTEIDMSNLDSSNVKAYLLFQAHFARLPLPIRDYITDTRLVIDSSIRLLHAMVEYSADQGFLETTLNVCTLTQMIFQGVWGNESCLINVPNFNELIVNKLGSEFDVKYLFELYEFSKSDKLEKFLVKVGLTQLEIAESISAIQTLPLIEMKTRIHGGSSDDQENSKDVLEEGGEAEIQVHLSRINSKESLKVLIQRTEKIKDCGWWIIIGCPSNNKVLGMKKINFKTSTRKNFNICLPESFYHHSKLRVYLMSDCYLGMDIISDINLEKRKAKKH